MIPDTVPCVKLLPGVVALRFWAKYTYHAADAG
jgi:hypothetical protein